MPRPPWNPTDEQQKLIAAATEEFQQADTLAAQVEEREEAGWAHVLAAIAAGAPKDRIAELIPRGRSSLYRRIETTGEA